MGQPDVQLTSTSDLKASKYNARTHSKKQIQQIANSILRFGWTSHILADDKGNIIAGHGRHLAAVALGLKTVPVITASHLTEVEKRALALADNKIADNAGWDRGKLVAELGELANLLPEINLDLSITGFEPAEIDALVADFADLSSDPADQPLPVHRCDPISRVGDLWQMAAHRLFCGDACCEADVAALMGGQLAAMLFADPPYNVSIKKTVGRGSIKHREFLQGSGELTVAQFTSFLGQSMQLGAQHSHAGSIHFFCMDWRHIAETITAGKGVYGDLKNLIVWVKTNAGQGSFYRSQHELICAFKNGDASHLNNIEQGKHGRNRSNVWTYAGVNTFRKERLQDLSVHPTVKPVALVADAIKDCTRRADIVLDPFIGSGTTILAAERTGRHAFGLEIDPTYVDAAIRRWQDFTKRDAILASTGQTFDELAALDKTRAGP
ncbi:ParB N-terminal domain-containing protein [Bradyrhizobium liaoningense]|nr:ParB N-terminal domain-containing protein [Bradyrhizobium liaoningense]